MMNVTKVLEKCTRKDYKALIQFLNDTFEKNEDKWFIKYVGRVYQEEDNMTDEMIGHTYLLKDNNQIAACIGIFPIDLCCRYGEDIIHLKMACIGSVAVGHHYRKLGLMSTMLEQVNRIIQEEGYHLSWLAGDRFRYKNYGWDCGGLQYKFTLSSRTLKRLHGDEIMQVKSADVEDIPILNTMYQRYDNASLRPDDIWKNLITCNQFRISKNGYLGYSQSWKDSILEVQGDKKDVLALLNNHAQEHQLSSLSIHCPHDTNELTKYFLEICDGYEIMSLGKIQIIQEEVLWNLIKAPLVKQLSPYCQESYIQGLCTNRRSDVIKKCLNIYMDNQDIPTPLPTVNYWLPTMENV